MASPTPVQPRSPPPEALPSIAGNGPNPAPPPQPAPTTKRTSLGFLRRAKSTEPLGDRKPSGKMSRKQKEQLKEEELRRQREAAAVPKYAPRLPDLAPPPQLNTFGGEDARPDSIAIISNQLGRYQSPPSTSQLRAHALAAPAPAAVPPKSSNSENTDPYARTESMTHRGRLSYASSSVSTINNPRKVRRRKDPTPYK